MGRLVGLASIVLAAFVSTCLVGSGGLTAASVPSTCDSLRIVVLGDSIAAGWPLDAPHRWSDTLLTTLRGARPDRCVEVRNVALGGSRIGYLESSIAAQTDLSTFQLAIVFEGVNDVGSLSIDDWQRRYATAVQGLEGRGLAVVVGTAPPLLVDGQFEDKFDELAATERSIAATGVRHLLDIELTWRNLGPEAAAPFYVDVIHPNGAGQAAIAAGAGRLILALPEANRP